MRFCPTISFPCRPAPLRGPGRVYGGIMTITTRTLILAAVLLVALQADTSDTWPLEPKDFRGVAFPGASKDEVMKKLSIDRRFCRATSCLDQRFALGDVSITTLFDFKDDRLTQIYLQFRSSGFDAVKEIFTERYGPPTRVEDTPVRTKAGVEYENQTVVWLGDAVEIHLVRYGGNIDEGSVLFYDRAWMAEQAKAAEEAKRKAAASF